MKRRSLLLALLVAPAAVAGWRRDNAELCARIDAKLKDIEAQRRIGYTPKRGRALQARREQLTAQRRERCR